MSVFCIFILQKKKKKTYPIKTEPSRQSEEDTPKPTLYYCLALLTVSSVCIQSVLQIFYAPYVVPKMEYVDQRRWRRNLWLSLVSSRPPLRGYISRKFVPSSRPAVCYTIPVCTNIRDPIIKERGEGQDSRITFAPK